jgi:hypothetical protein
MKYCKKTIISIDKLYFYLPTLANINLQLKYYIYILDNQLSRSYVPSPY